MRSHRSAALIALLAVCATCLMAGPAAAAPLTKRRDRSDNTMYFQYNPATGRIDSAFSSRLVRRGDRVDFLTYAMERHGADEGRRLRARINVRLNRDRGIRYDGIFTVVVQDDVGATVYEGTRDVNFVLRPREGLRSRRMRWIFDLSAPGYYTIFAKFRAET
jgi:hypothetical protein